MPPPDSNNATTVMAARRTARRWKAAIRARAAAAKAGSVASRRLPARQPTHTRSVPARLTVKKMNRPTIAATPAGAKPRSRHPARAPAIATTSSGPNASATTVSEFSRVKGASVKASAAPAPSSTSAWRTRTMAAMTGTALAAWRTSPRAFRVRAASTSALRPKTSANRPPRNGLNTTASASASPAVKVPASGVAAPPAADTRMAISPRAQAAPC